MIEIIREISQSAQQKGFQITQVQFSKRINFESETHGDELLSFITFYLLHKNRNILGDGENIFEEVYPRCKKIKKDILSDISLPSNLRIEFYLKISSDSIEGESYEKENINSFGDKIISIDELCKNSAYYDKLRKDYKIDYGVKTNNNTVIGPDAGLIITSCLIGDYFNQLGSHINITEVGAGSCSTPLSILEHCSIANYTAFDFSNNMKAHYDNIIKNHFEKLNISSSFVVSDSLSCNLPCEVDLLVLGIYYECQLDFIKYRGDEIKQLLHGNGAIIMQCGLQENLMFTDLLTEKGKSEWPWHDEKCCLKTHFKYVMKVNAYDEIMLIATDNKNLFDFILSTENKYISLDKIF